MELIYQVLILSRVPYRFVQSSEEGLRLALIVVFVAGLSQALSQSVALFAYRVRPRRFVLSLLVGAGVYLFGFLFLVSSVWFVARYFFGETVPLLVVVRTVGLAYAPYLFSFVILTPYFRVFFVGDVGPVEFERDAAGAVGHLRFDAVPGAALQRLGLAVAAGRAAHRRAAGAGAGAGGAAFGGGAKARVHP